MSPNTICGGLCKTCVWWENDGSVPSWDYGDCRRIAADNPRPEGVPYCGREPANGPTFWTPPTFGCTLWESKEGDDANGD